MSDEANASHAPTTHLRFVRRRGYGMAPGRKKHILVLQQWFVPVAGDNGRGAWPEWRDVALDKSGA